MDRLKYKLVVGIPTYGLPKSEFAIDSLGSLLFHIGRRYPEVDVVLNRDVRTYRQEARKGIVEYAQKCEATHLLMLDDDHVFSSTDFDLLWKSMVESSDVYMVSGLYFTRGLPTVPCIFKLTERGTAPIFFYPENEIFKVDVVGFGFVLFDMVVFKELNPPWFNLGFGFGEDAAFCARMLQKGLGVYVHTGAKIGHLLEQPHVITEADYLPSREQHRQYGTSHSLVPAEYIQRDGVLPGSGASPVYRPTSRRLWHRLGWKKNSGGGACGLDPHCAGGEVCGTDSDTKDGVEALAEGQA